MPPGAPGPAFPYPSYSRVLLHAKSAGRDMQQSPRGYLQSSGAEHLRKGAGLERLPSQPVPYFVNLSRKYYILYLHKHSGGVRLNATVDSLAPCAQCAVHA